MGRARSADPLQQYRYRVEIEGIAELGFSSVDGLESEIEVAEYREGGYKTIHKLPGQEKTGTITLERGATRDLQMYEWYNQALTDSNFRRTVTIIELDYDMETELRRHVLYEAWASKFTRPRYEGTSSEVAIDAVEIQCEQIESDNAG